MTATITQLAPATDPFDTWWAGWINKVGKKDARKAFPAALKIAGMDKLMAGSELYAKWCRASDQEKQYQLHPATYLRGERWEDELEMPAYKSTGGGICDYVEVGPEMYRKYCEKYNFSAWQDGRGGKVPSWIVESLK